MMRTDDEWAAIDLLADAMQAAWDEFCADTGCIPDCFTIHGPATTRVSANFRYGNFASFVADRLAAAVSGTKNEED